MWSRRSRMAPPRPRSFSSEMPVPQCGPPSPLRMKRTTALRTPWTAGAAESSRVSRICSAEPRTFRSEARPGCRSSGGRSAQDRCTRRPSALWCTRISACGMPTAAHSHSANASICRRAIIAPAPARPARTVPASPRARSAPSPRAATTSRSASPTSRAGRVCGASARDALQGTRARSDDRRRTLRRRPHSTCGRSSMRGGVNRGPREALMVRSITDGANLPPVVEARGKRG